MFIVLTISFTTILFNNQSILGKVCSFFVVFVLVLLSPSLIEKIKEEEPSIKNDGYIKEEDVINNDYLQDYNEKRHKQSTLALYVKQIGESIKILESTKNPDNFFSRYNFIIERLNQAIKIIDSIDISYKSQNDYLYKFKTNKAKIINDFAYKYYETVLFKIQSLKTKKAKINNANKFYESLMKY